MGLQRVECYRLRRSKNINSARLQRVELYRSFKKKKNQKHDLCEALTAGCLCIARFRMNQFGLRAVNGFNFRAAMKNQLDPKLNR